MRASTASITSSGDVLRARYRRTSSPAGTKQISRLRSVTRSRAGDRRRRAHEGRPAAEHEPARHPLHRPYREIAEPHPGCEELERPDAEDDHELPAAVDATEQPEAVAVEDRRADHGLQQVVGEGHSSDGDQRTKWPAALAQEHHERGPAQRHEQIAPVVQRLADQHEVQQIPASREAPPHSERVQQRTDAKPDYSHSHVEGSRSHGAENTRLEETHSHQHQTGRLPEEMGDEIYGFRLESRWHSL